MANKLTKKSKLLSMSQADGKYRPEEDENNENKQEYEVTSLSMLWGESNGTEKYSTMDVEEYEAQLNDMVSADLRRHAIEVAHVVPSTSVERLKKRLISEFKKHVAQFRVPKYNNKKEKPASKEVLKIMAEAK